MKNHGLTAIVLSMVLLLGLLAPIRWEPVSVAASPKLSKEGLTIRVGGTAVLKMKNTTMPVFWSVKRGKEYIALKNVKKKKVTILGKDVGVAVVKAEIQYSAKKKKVYKCKVIVRKAQWECPQCGQMNTGNYCTRCGYPKPGTTPSPTPTQDPTPTPTGPVISTYTPMPTAPPIPGVTVSPGVTQTPNASAIVMPTFMPVYSPTPTPTPIGPDDISEKNMVMLINNIPISMRLYANSSAVTFYNRLGSDTAGAYSGLNLEPAGSDDYAIPLSAGIASFASSSTAVGEGELYLYGNSWLKVSVNAHQASTEPTRIAIPRTAEDLENLRYALTLRVGGRITVSFKQKV